MDKNIKDRDFAVRLMRLRRYWQVGLLVRDLLKVTGVVIVLLLTYGILDFFMAFAAPTRIIMSVISLLSVMLLGLVLLARVLRLSDREMAVRADRLLRNGRRSVLSGLELDLELKRRSESMPEMRAFLLKRCVSRSQGDLNQVTVRKCYPVRENLQQIKVLSIQGIAACLIVFSSLTASGIILKRVLLPHRDVPPYSKFSFDVTPAKPQVIYGGSIEIQTRITGGDIDSQVWLLTRYGGSRHKTACFKASSDVFAQRLEKVVSPVEFCFVTGKARSKWHKVGVLLQPRIAVASAVVTPPKYTRLPPRQFYLGSEDLTVYSGSKIELSVTSNRPLLDGNVTVKPDDGRGYPDGVKGRKTGSSTVAFEWTAESSAKLEIVVRDIQGTKNETPFVVEQTLLEDKPPETIISEPASFVMVTPYITIPLRGYAEDDLALRRVELVRTVVGYRDRIKPLGPGTPEKRLNVDTVLDMKKLGVEPGQLLEFYLEAGDLNPSLLGISASSVVRVQIISEEEYAATLRAKETFEAFLSRFRVMSEEMQKVRKDVQKLKKLLESTSATNEQIKQATEEAMETMSRASVVLKEIADDFPIYDMESELGMEARKKALRMREMAQQLGSSAISNAVLLEETNKILEEMGGVEREAESMYADAEEVEKIYRLMECANRFSQIYRRQSELVNRLQRFETEAKSEDLRLLESLGARQEEIRKSLLTLFDDIKERAENLSEYYEELKLSALDFTRKIAELEIPEYMNRAVAAAKNQDGPNTLRNATLALERLEQMLSESQDEPFGGMCQGGIKFEVRRDIQKTLQQMMQSLGSGSGQGVGTGGSGLGGGDANDGFSMAGYSPVNTPTYGPKRGRVPGVSGSGKSHGSGGQGVSMDDVTVEESETMMVRGSSTVHSEGLPMEDIPEKYRDAVKKYFTDGND